jgi:hypothetical protein
VKTRAVGAGCVCTVDAGASGVRSVALSCLFQPMNRRCKNVAARTNHIASGENPDFIDHCGRSILYGSYGGRIESMVVETVLFIAFVVAGGTVIVKAYEWHQDVLYGPYMKRTD